MSGFSTLNTAISGLAAAQRSMDSTSQNIVNANTPGYSRQRVMLTSVGPNVAASLQTGHEGVFGGVRVSEVARIRDAFLEGTRAAVGARQAALGARDDILSAVQTLTAEPGDTGLQSTMDSFYASWQDMANNPTDTAAGSVVIQRGIAVTEQLRSLSYGISEQWMTAHDNLTNVVSEVNQAVEDLAGLNQGIRAGQAAGNAVNEAMDARDVTVRHLATLIGAYATTNENGEVSVSVNGINMVSGGNFQKIAITGANHSSAAGTDPVVLMVGHFVVPVESGTAAGYLAVANTDLPQLSTAVDNVATSIRDSVNALHNQGFTPAGDPGGDFFSGTDAFTLGVVPTAGTGLALAGAPGKVDGSNAVRLGDLADDAKSAALLGHTGPSAQWRSLTTALGVQLQSLKTAKSVQDAVVAAADDAIQSDAGVNLDEEMTHMMLYQRCYQASARLISTVDEMLDTLVSRTGLVGR